MKKTKRWYEELYEGFDAYNEEPYVQNTCAEVDFIEQVIAGERTKAILDVGCGNGRHALELARRGYRVLGVDLSASMLAQARRVAASEKLAVHFMQGDARDLPFESRFEVAIMLCEGAFSLMESDAMDFVILTNVCRALKPGGHLIMTAPNAAFMLAQPPNEAFDLTTLRETFTLDTVNPDGARKMLDCTQRYYTCPELRVLLEQADFRAIEFFACTEAGYDCNQQPAPTHFEFGVIAKNENVDSQLTALEEPYDNQERVCNCG